MSERRIGVAAEGIADQEVIQAALAAILPEPMVVSPLQPEDLYPSLGLGWCGVARWCIWMRRTGGSLLQGNPTLPDLDLVVLQVDADVAQKSYTDCRPPIDAVAQQLGALPENVPCPPPRAAADKLRKVVPTWLGISTLDARTILCVPSKSIDAWVAVALAPEMPDLDLADIECETNPKDRLFNLPLGQRLKKGGIIRQYRDRVVPAITTRWPDVCTICSQAQRFHDDVREAIGS